MKRLNLLSGNHLNKASIFGVIFIFGFVFSQNAVAQQNSNQESASVEIRSLFFTNSITDSLANAVLVEYQNTFSLLYDGVQHKSYPIKHLSFTPERPTLAGITPPEGLVPEKMRHYQEYGISFGDVLLESAVSLPIMLFGGSNFINRQIRPPLQPATRNRPPTPPDWP